MRILVVVLVALSSTLAFAQESEFKGKLTEDMNSAAGSFKNGCGVEVEVEWAGGKLGHNPRESEKPEWNAISTMVGVGAEAAESACLNNTVVKEKLGKVKKLVFTRGKGALDYKLAGTTFTIVLDASFVKNNPAGQRDDLVVKLKKALDD